MKDGRVLSVQNRSELLVWSVRDRVCAETASHTSTPPNLYPVARIMARASGD